jgi:hypothetical protein
MLMKTMSGFHNKEALSKFISKIFSMHDSDYTELLVKHISGVPVKLSYSLGMTLLVQDFALSTWEIDRSLSVVEKYAINEEGRHYFKAKIIDVDVYSPRPYGITYSYVNNTGDHVVKETYVSGKHLKSLVNL